MQHQYESVCLAGLGTFLPPRVVSSEEIENRLSPLYERLGLHVGRLELMTGIKSRRWGEPGLRPSEMSLKAGREAIEKSGIDPSKIGCLIHASVCRDFLEPATATVVHHGLGLSSGCQVFDLSDACLGWMDGLSLLASMVQAGRIEAGLVVSGEDGRALVETTIDRMNQDASLTRQSMKSSFASLTIGSGGVAAVVAKEELASQGHRMLGMSSQCATEHHGLCQGGISSEESTRTQVDMVTDSESMLHAGVALANQNFGEICRLLQWSPETLDRIITHQVGSAHRNLLFESMGLDPRKDYPTFPSLGNMGSASIGVTLALAEIEGHLSKNDKTLLMGIGSGLVSIMMGLEW